VRRQGDRPQADQALLTSNLRLLAQRMPCFSVPVDGAGRALHPSNTSPEDHTMPNIKSRADAATQTLDDAMERARSI
jgi:hypothetical protein